MYFKKLELSGFKSFAKQTLFDFSDPITAVVGPNGSGKSNIVEAIRWALGEQALKNMRGKRGEDFIFSGSQRAPRLSRASVSITLDNNAKQFPVAFDEIMITRRVSRDGVNQYFLNGSRVRLKDIVELLASVGLGITQHHIISQGEADRILLASSEERRMMIEDALGLKSYHLKRHEAELKLARTEDNMKQVSLLQKEIRPHLKYLEKQAEKMRKAETLRANLKKQYEEYICKEQTTLLKEEGKIKLKQMPFLEKQRQLTEAITDIQKTIANEEKAPYDAASDEGGGIEKQIRELESKMREFERNMGRIEGRLEDMRAREGGESKNVSAAVVKNTLQELLSMTDALFHEEEIAAVRSSLRELQAAIQRALHMFGEEKEDMSGVSEALEKERERVRAAIQKTGKELDAHIAEKRALERKESKRFMRLRDKERDLRMKERELEEAKEQAKELNFMLERTRIRQQDLSGIVEEAGRLFNLRASLIAGTEGFMDDAERDAMKKKLDRLRIKIEESGAVDEAVLKEYQEVAERDTFLNREMKDIADAVKSLKSLIQELADRLEKEFADGVEKINAEFQKFFAEMFHGGQAELRVAEQGKRGIKKDMLEGLEGNEAVECEEQINTGVDIKVVIPGKRIHALNVLSGGERALVSIALLFAMSAVNPPPFLVLDETDAALDEANSRRYAALLKSLSKKTQLIVVTHNRETMRAAGVLYGVTIGGDGISKLLSLKLEEAVEVAE